jgi:hypothetical protein
MLSLRDFYEIRAYYWSVSVLECSGCLAEEDY